MIQQSKLPMHGALLPRPLFFVLLRIDGLHLFVKSHVVDFLPEGVHAFLTYLLHAVVHIVDPVPMEEQNVNAAHDPEQRQKDRPAN